MNTRKEERKIKKLIDDLTPMFNLQLFRKDIIIEKEDRKSWSASVEVDFVYKYITICVYPTFFRQTPDEQRRSILHELCHTLTLRTYYNACEILKGKLFTDEHLTDEMESDNCKVEYILDSLLKGQGQEYKLAYKKYIYGDTKTQNRKRRR